MTLDYRTATLPEIIGDMEAIAAEVAHGLRRLTEVQLNWKPNADEWGVVQYQAVHTRLTEQMRALQEVDAARLKVTSPFASFVAYSALDACRVIAAHERVHLNQAGRVMAAPGHP